MSYIENIEFINRNNYSCKKLQFSDFIRYCGCMTCDDPGSCGLTKIKKLSETLDMFLS